MIFGNTQSAPDFNDLSKIFMFARDLSFPTKDLDLMFTKFFLGNFSPLKTTKFRLTHQVIMQQNILGIGGKYIEMSLFINQWHHWLGEVCFAAGLKPRSQNETKLLPMARKQFYKPRPQRE